jgi:hypothetical protein
MYRMLYILWKRDGDKQNIEAACKKNGTGTEALYRPYGP